MSFGIKKTVSLIRDIYALEYALYYVDEIHNTFTFNRQDYILPVNLFCIVRICGAGRTFYEKSDTEKEYYIFCFSLSRRSEVER